MTTPIPFLTMPEPAYGAAIEVSPLIRSVAARNPGAFTYWGSQSFILGHGRVAVIDPGPDAAGHVEALLAALAGETVTHVILTHPHADHAEAAPRLAAATGAEIIAFASPLEEGATIAGDDWTLEAIHTPGHCRPHLCFALAEECTIFTGDHVMGWSTSVIAPPDGDLAEYQASLERLSRRPEPLFRPTHGPAVSDGPQFAARLLRHRQERTAELVAALERGPGTIPDLVERIYIGLNPALKTGAGHSLRAHLALLGRLGEAVAEGEVWRLV